MIRCFRVVPSLAIGGFFLFLRELPAFFLFCLLQLIIFGWSEFNWKDCLFDFLCDLLPKGFLERLASPPFNPKTGSLRDGLEKGLEFIFGWALTLSIGFTFILAYGENFFKLVEWGFTS